VIRDGGECHGRARAAARGDSRETGTFGKVRETSPAFPATNGRGLRGRRRMQDAIYDRVGAWERDGKFDNMCHLTH